MQKENSFIFSFPNENTFERSSKVRKIRSSESRKISFFCRKFCTFRFLCIFVAIGSYAFSYCSNLTSITLPEDLTAIGEYAFDGCSGLTSIIIPNAVTSIGQQAFYGCSNLKSVTLGRSVTEIGSLAFYGCDDLEEVISYIEEPFAVGYVFIRSNFMDHSNATLYVPAGTKEKYEATDGWKRFQSIEEMGGTEPQNPDTPGVVNLVRNSDMEGTDVSSFLVKIGGVGGSPQAAITDGVGKDGSRGIKFEATKREKYTYENQFWIYLDQPVSNGTKYRLSFSCRADKDANVNSEFQAEPGSQIGSLKTWEFLQEWKDYEVEGAVSNSSDEKPLHSIAFHLSTYSDANTYYFDNIKFEVFLDGECPKPTFTSDGNELSIHSPFTNAIYYTLDGSEPTISSSLYTSPLTLNLSCTVKAIAVVDGSNISPVASYNKFVEDTPPEGYVSLRNVPFCSWNDWGANANSTGSADCLWIIGENASVVYGDASVINYADLSNYSKLVIKVSSGTPRLLFNRDVDEGQYSGNEAQSHLIEIPKSGWPERYYTVEYTDEDRVYTIDLEQITKDKGYCHLHAIKGQNGNNILIKGMYVQPLN